MPADSFYDAALAYAELGYSVFPCRPGSKKPLCNHGLLEATTDATQIQKWWSDQPFANIGVRTDGLIVVDAEVDATWLAHDPDKSVELSVAPLSLTAHGGQHFVFRQPADRDWRNTCGRLGPRVDTRGNGGYIVVPPSTLDDNLVYRWAEGHELNVPPERLPEPPMWLGAQLDSLATGTNSTTADTESAFDTRDPVIANTIPTGQRNATLARLAGVMRRSGMSRDEILAALLQVNDGRCNPPINRAEVARIAASIARYAPDEVAVALSENHWEQMYSDVPEASNEHGDPGPIPAGLLAIPGFVADVMDYTLTTAPYPDSTLAFAGALSLQAHLAARKVRDEADNRTNLYLLALANSGGGKEFPRKVNQRILMHVGLADSFADSFASGEGIEDRLLQNAAMLFQTDEIDGLMTKINQAKDGRHEEIMKVLMKMNTCANGTYTLRVKAGKMPGTIDQPSLNIFGTAIPKHYYEALSTKMLTNGFIARTIVLESQGRGRGRDAVVRELPAPILEVARYWADFRPGQNGNLHSLHPAPRVVAQTEEAARIICELREFSDQQYNVVQARDDPMSMSIWARVHEMARRLALVYACSENHQDPTIDEAAARWACQLTSHQTRRMLFMAAGHVSENDFDARCKAVLATLTRWRDRHGDAQMPFWKLNRKHPWSEKDHDEVRKALLNQHLIEFEVGKTGGTPQRLYRLA